MEVLARFRLGKFACMADLSKCFFQIAMPEEQRDLFRIIWFKDNNIDGGDMQVYRFVRHVWGINSSPYTALLSIQHLLSENPTNACEKTLTVLEKSRYMDDVLFSSDSLSELVTMSRESIELFKSRGFILRKWVVNSSAKSILSEIPKCDFATNISEIAIGSEPMPDSKALGVVWDVENDKLKVNMNKNLVDVTTRCEMASQLASYFDPLGMIAPCILRGKLILQRVAQAKFDWDDKLPDDILHSWNLWSAEFNALSSVSLDRYCFPEGENS